MRRRGTSLSPLGSCGDDSRAAAWCPLEIPGLERRETWGTRTRAIKFHFNDDHELGIYSWQFLRDWCPCEECKAARSGVEMRWPRFLGAKQFLGTYSTLRLFQYRPRQFSVKLLL